MYVAWKKIEAAKCQRHDKFIEVIKFRMYTIIFFITIKIKLRNIEVAIKN